MLQNAKLTPDTLNALVFQLTNTVDNKIDTAGISILKKLIKVLFDHIKRSKIEVVIEDADTLLRIFSEANCDNTLEPSSFSFELTASSLSHITIAQSPAFRSSLLRKRNIGNTSRDEYIKRLKFEHVCRACGKIGHF